MQNNIDDQNPPITEDVITPNEESYKEYLDFFSKEGLIELPEDFEFEDSEEGYKTALQKAEELKASKIKESLLSSVHPDLLPVVKYALSGASSLEEVLPVAPKSFSIETEEQQKETIKAFYKASTSLSDSRINALLAKIDDPDELLAEAKEAQASLQQIQAAKASELEQRLENARKEKEEAAKKTIENLKTTIQSYTDSKPLKNKLQGFFFNEVKTPSGTTSEFSHVLSSILQNPQHTVQLADILVNYDSKKGIDLSRFELQGANKANYSMRTLLEKAASKPAKSTQVLPKEDFDWEAYLNL